MASARRSALGSSWASSGRSTARRISGESPGSRRRASSPSMGSQGTPSASRTLVCSASWATSPSVRATRITPQRVKPTSRPCSRRSHAACSAWSSRLASPRDSPGPGWCASIAGPRMPAAALDASAPGTERSSTVTASPAWASDRATEQPMIPPPTTMTSALTARTIAKPVSGLRARPGRAPGRLRGRRSSGTGPRGPSPGSAG